MSNPAIPEWLAYFVYSPLDWQRKVGYGVDTTGRCRASVYRQGEFLAGQCARKGTQEILGHRFCAQHGKRVTARMERDKA